MGKKATKAKARWVTVQVTVGVEPDRCIFFARVWSDAVEHLLPSGVGVPCVIRYPWPNEEKRDA